MNKSRILYWLLRALLISFYFVVFTIGLVTLYELWSHNSVREFRADPWDETRLLSDTAYIIIFSSGVLVISIVAGMLTPIGIKREK